MNNTELLSRTSRIWRSKRSQKDQDLEVKFDDDQRAAYLTGFHKRNVEKRKARVEKAKLIERRYRAEHRAEVCGVPFLDRAPVPPTGRLNPPATLLPSYSSVCRRGKP